MSKDYNPSDELDKLAKAEKARQDAQQRYETEERIRRQREISERAKLNEFRNRSNSQGGRQSVDLRLEKVPTARKMEPPKTKVSAASNRAEIQNIKNQARMSSSSNNKLSMKQSLGKSVASGAQRYDNKLQDQDTVAKVAKEDAMIGGKKVLTAVGAGTLVKGGEAVSAGLGHLQADDSAQEMTKIAGDIVTKGANNVIHYRENCAKRAEEEVRKQARKVEKLDKQYDKLNSKELKTREKAGKSYDKSDKYKTKADKASAKGKTGKADRYSAKANKHSARGDKLNNRSNKLRDKRAKKNMKLGKKRGKAVAKLNKKKIKATALKKIAAKGLSKALLVKVGAIVIIPVSIVLLIVTLIGGGAGSGAYLVTKFVSEVFDFLSLDWTPTGKRLAELENMNWAQYIADGTTHSLGQTFTEAAKKDAKAHYTEKKITLSSALTTLGDDTTPRYDWYCDLGEGSIGSIWMREQCDNITDKNGQMIFDSEGNKQSGSTTTSNLLYVNNGVLQQMSSNAGYDMPYHYEPDEGSRLVITPNANIVPIMSLAHDRYTEEWTWENYEVVMAYVWYMYTLSHNSAHYDAGIGYDADDSKTYTYTTQQMCNHTVFTNSSYLNKFNYDRGSVNLTRPSVSQCSCTNVYIHGYNKDSIFGNATFKENVKSNVKKTAKKVLSWLDGIVEAVTGKDSDLAETIMQAGTYTISYERDADSGYYVSGNRTWANDNAMYSDYGPELLNQFLGGVANGKGTIVFCDNIQYKQKNGTTVCGKSEHIHNRGSCTCSTEIHDHTSGCTYTCAGIHEHKPECEGTKTNCSSYHKHTYGSHSAGHCFDTSNMGVGCQYGKEEHICENLGCQIVTGKCTRSEHLTHNADGSCCSKIKHEKHTSSCCTIKHTTHQEWNGVNDPGCYDTFAYCAGHCGGHIKPTVNLAITYTMEGLAYQDAVTLDAGSNSGDSSSWTGENDFKFLIDDLNDVGNLKEWAEVTNIQCGEWFEAGPNGPISALCYMREAIDKTYLKIFRGWRDFWKGVADFFLGTGEDKESYHDAPSDEEYTGTGTGVDAHKFEGWFEGSKNNLSFKRNLFRELHDLYGDPDNFYQTGIKNWEDFDVQFNIGFGQVLSDERIDGIIETITNKYYTTDAEKEKESTKYRLAIVREALESCGYFYYSNNSTSLTSPSPAHFNGMYSSMGTSDGLGFVSGIYMRVLGSKCGWWSNVSSTYISPGTGENGVKFGQGTGGIISYLTSTLGSGRVGCQLLGGISNAKPGDVIVKGNTDEAAIYLGYYTDPVTNATLYWVVNCCSDDATNNTASYRCLTSFEAGGYDLVYRANVIK